MADDDTPQSNVQDDQNFDPDVKKMFKHFITGGHTPDENEGQKNVGIDDIRGQISATVTVFKTKDLIKALNLDLSLNTPASTPNTSTPAQLSQESRCHALYRVIGFPVVNSSKNDFYNPGFDIVLGDNITRTIKPDRKLRIASNVGDDFEKISNVRERYASQAAAVFSVPSSVEAGVLALTSGTFDREGNINKRKFAQTFEKATGPFDFLPAHQSYSAPGNIGTTKSLVGNYSVLLSDYQDKNADLSRNFKPNPNIGGYTVLTQHQHVIIPFMVDPRIDFSIWASESKTASGVSRRIAIPFVPDASFLKTSSTASAERPLLEKIIRDRFATPTVSDAGITVADTVAYIQGNKDLQSVQIGGIPIGNIFSGDVYKTSQQEAFAQYLHTIQSLMAKLADSIKAIQTAQSTYYWLPIPNSVGPEGGCTIRNIQVSKNVDRSLITDEDLNIIEKSVNSIMSNLNNSYTQSTATPDAGNFAFSNHKLTFDSSTSDSQGDLTNRSQESLNEKRNSILNKAAESLQIFEMIMGEFSGLGLADLIAIVGALYVMPINDVLGFLDDDAIVRAEVSLGQPADSLKSKRSGIDTAMTSLFNTVNAFYQIMDQVFQEKLNNNARRR